MDVSFCNNVAVVQQHDGIRHHVYLVQNMARYNQVQALPSNGTEKIDRLSARHRVKAV